MPVRQVLGVERPAARLQGRRDDECVVEGAPPPLGDIQGATIELDAGEDPAERSEHLGQEPASLRRGVIGRANLRVATLAPERPRARDPRVRSVILGAPAERGRRRRNVCMMYVYL